VKIHHQLKNGVKWMWSLGDYAEVAKRLLPCAEALVQATGIHREMTVLDVAAGNGNFALTAARTGATVTASDLTPQMVALGRARSAAESLAIEWREADAEQLPFDANQFDVVASVFGAMFAPDPARVTTELFRVARPGGIVAMANYAPDGFLGGFADLITRYAPPAPTALPSPFRWGHADEVHRRFGDWASSIMVEGRTLTFAFENVTQALAFWERTNGPMIALQSMIPPETYRALTKEATHLLTDLNHADDGRLMLKSPYLQVIARKKALVGG